MRLYDIADEIRTLVDRTDDGEVTDSQLNDLDMLGVVLNDKIDACCALIREWESQVAARQAEIDRLKSGIQTRENNVRRVKEYMRQALERIGETKHETPLFTIRRQASPPSCKCLVDPTELDERYVRVNIEPNNALVLQEYKQFGTTPLGFAIEQGEHLRIK